jgi:hypothetical protein
MTTSAHALAATYEGTCAGGHFRGHMRSRPLTRAHALAATYAGLK